MGAEIIVVGGGLAGSEAAWQAAERGVEVRLYEMRPHRMTPAHVSGRLAELVCSNSLLRPARSSGGAPEGRVTVPELAGACVCR